MIRETIADVVVDWSLIGTSGIGDFSEDAKYLLWICFTIGYFPTKDTPCNVSESHNLGQCVRPRTFFSILYSLTKGQNCDVFFYLRRQWRNWK